MLNLRVLQLLLKFDNLVYSLFGSRKINRIISSLSYNLKILKSLCEIKLSVDILYFLVALFMRLNLQTT